MTLVRVFKEFGEKLGWESRDKEENGKGGRGLLMNGRETVTYNET